MLDTDTCIYAMKHHPAQARQRLRRAPIGEVGISAIVLAKSERREDNTVALQDFIAYCIVLDWPQDPPRRRRPR